MSTFILALQKGRFLLYNVDNMKKNLTIISFVFALSITACDGLNTHIVTFDSNGGSSVSSQTVKHGEKAEKPEDPTREGYTFKNWTYNNEEWSFIGYSVTNDMTLLANWDVNTYKLTLYNSNQVGGTVKGMGSYAYDSDVTIVATPSAGYSFVGWYDSNNVLVSAETSYSFKMGLDLKLTAKWNDGNKYTISLNPNSGTISQTTIDVQYGRYYTLPTPERKGYTFNGWFSGSTNVDTYGIWSYPTIQSLTASWSITNYTITYNLNGGDNNSSNPATYTINDGVTFANPSRQGYRFEGWYKDDSPITSIPVGSTGDITIEARWMALKNTLTITSEDDSKGTVAITSGTGYSGESITVVATPATGYLFKGWFDGAMKVSELATYTFEMPTKDYSLVGKFYTQEEKETEERNIALGVIPTIDLQNKIIKYGLYPQKNIDNSSLIEALNNLLTPESNGWYLYNNEYYAKVVSSPYSGNYRFDNNVAISFNTTYWFKCEPITWNILVSGNYCLLLSSALLDAHPFSGSNYKNSGIRTWLNGTFYNSAFALGNSYIKTTEVNNSAATTDSKDNPYACENTEDNVFLLCVQEYLLESYGFIDTGGFNNETRCCKTTDWARANGAYCSKDSRYLYNGEYWTRSPSANYPGSAYFIGESGGINVSIDENLIFTTYLPEICARPAIVFKLA